MLRLGIQAHSLGIAYNLTNILTFQSPELILFHTKLEAIYDYFLKLPCVRSNPHKPLIANGFFRSGQIEAWGCSIEKNDCIVSIVERISARKNGRWVVKQKE